MVHSSASIEALRSTRMVLSAVATTMASSTAISEPAEVSASTHVLVAPSFASFMV